MNKTLEKLNNRVLELSIKHNLSHLGSCFTTLPIILEIFEKKRKEDRFVLSNGHAGLSYYVILEHFTGVDAEMLLVKHGIHPERDIENGIEVSTGSLGLGLTIATGMAVANPNTTVYCIISDGESAEGSIWESLRFIEENNISNIEVYVNINGWAAYKPVDSDKLSNRLKAFLPTINLRYMDVNETIEFETPLAAHYTMANNNMKIKTKSI